MYVRVFHQRQSSVRQLVVSLVSKYSEEGGASLYVSPHLQSVWDTHEMLVELMDEFTVPGGICQARFPGTVSLFILWDKAGAAPDWPTWDVCSGHQEQLCWAGVTTHTH